MSINTQKITLDKIAKYQAIQKEIEEQSRTNNQLEQQIYQLSRMSAVFSYALADIKDLVLEKKEIQKQKINKENASKEWELTKISSSSDGKIRGHYIGLSSRASEKPLKVLSVFDKNNQAGQNAKNQDIKFKLESVANQKTQY